VRLRDIAASLGITRLKQTHGRLKAWVWPTRGQKRHRSSRTIAAGYAFGQNPCRGHFDIAIAVRNRHRLRVASSRG
jgi:hypothetical protein